MVVRLFAGQTRRCSWLSLDSSLRYLGDVRCPSNRVSTSWLGSVYSILYGLGCGRRSTAQTLGRRTERAQIARCLGYSQRNAGLGQASPFGLKRRHKPANSKTQDKAVARNEDQLLAACSARWQRLCRGRQSCCSLRNSRKRQLYAMLAKAVRYPRANGIIGESPPTPCSARTLC